MSLPADVLAVAVKLVDVLLDIVGERNAHALTSLVTDRAAERQMTAADIAKAAKFGPER